MVDVKEKTPRLQDKGILKPSVFIIRESDHTRELSYIRRKRKTFKKMGILSLIIKSKGHLWARCDWAIDIQQFNTCCLSEFLSLGWRCSCPWFFVSSPSALLRIKRYFIFPLRLSLSMIVLRLMLLSGSGWMLHITYQCFAKTILFKGTYYFIMESPAIPFSVRKCF